MKDATPTGTGGLHLTFLDSLRGIAILLVLLVHSSVSAYTSQTSITWKLAFMGQRGVELFYMVSAFTLFLSLDRARPENRPELNFFLRRFFRIAPAFYFVLVAELLLFGLWHPGRYRYALAFLFLNGWWPHAINLSIIGSWSVAVEWTFYLFVPWLHGRIRSLRDSLFWLAGSMILFIPGSYLLAVLLKRDLADYFELLWFPVQVPVFLLGVVAYRLWKEHAAPATSAWTAEQKKTIASILFALALLVFFTNVEWRDRHQFFNMRLFPCAVSFVFLILGGSLWEWPVLFNRFTRFIGKISYSMYLAHFFLLWEYARHFPPPPAAWLREPEGTVIIFCTLLAIMTPVSYLMWRFLEQPGIRLGRHIIQKVEHRRILPPPSLADRAGL